MSRLPATTNRPAFTLVEVLIVVTILGILAAAVLPTFNGHRQAANEAALAHSLATVRRQIALYKAQNRGIPPGDLGTEADFQADLAPLLPMVPANPIKRSATIAVKADGLTIAGTVGGSAGWRYDAKTGEFRANSGGTASDGRRYHHF